MLRRLIDQYRSRGRRMKPNRRPHWQPIPIPIPIPMPVPAMRIYGHQGV